jgi:hypothetical protein
MFEERKNEGRKERNKEGNNTVRKKKEERMNARKKQGWK